jgi:predicted phage terminase large subunit-like protein
MLDIDPRLLDDTPEKWSLEALSSYIWLGHWKYDRRDNQTPPPGDWTVWLILAGRGFGKTRTGVEWIAEEAFEDGGSRSLVAGRTTSDMRSTLFEGESGLLAKIPPELVISYNKSLFELNVRGRNGKTSLIKGIGAEEPSAFRGPQWHRALLDELAAWTYAQETWDMIMFSLRLGQRPQVVVTTTPRPIDLIKQMVSGKMAFPVHVTVGSTYDNLANLAPTFRQQILQYEGTELGRQEIHAEILEGSGGIIKRAAWRLWPATKPLPPFIHLVMSLDTAFTEKARNKDRRSEDFGKADPTACSVWGLFRHPDGPLKGKWGILLLDCWEDHLGFPQLVERVKAEAKIKYGGDDRRPMYGPNAGKPDGYEIDQLIIEEKGSGISLIQTLASEGVFAQPYNPGKADKLERLHTVSHLFMGGKKLPGSGLVFVVESDRQEGKPKTWANPLIDQVCAYAGENTTKHDDFVDSTSQALKYLMDWGRIQITVPEEVEVYDPKRDKDRGNPYG